MFPEYFGRDNLIQDSLTLPSKTISASAGFVDPDEYLMGPGDQIFVSIRGLDEIAYNLSVNPEGYIFIPKVGSISLREKNITEARKSIIESVNKTYKNVEVFVTLQNIRRIRVGLYGDVKFSDYYVLDANSRLSDLISISAAITQTSNLRNISITNSKGETKSYDYIAFIRLGDLQNNPLLFEGDYIFIQKSDRIVSISGSVMFPGFYEFRENETVDYLIQIAGGLTSSARIDSIEIIRFKDDNKTQFSIYKSYEELIQNQFTVNNQDWVAVRNIPEYLQGNFINIEGLVRSPGFYKIIENETTLSQIIEEAGGLLPNASIVDATLIRFVGDNVGDPEFDRIRNIPRQDMTDDEYDYLKSKSRQRVGRVVVDFNRLLIDKNKTEDVVLKNRDVINFPEKRDYIIMLGQVVNQGNIIYSRELTVEDYINLAGGFGWRAQEGNVRVIKANTGEWVDADDVKSLEPGDTIWIPEEPAPVKFWDVFTDVLNVLGQVATVLAATVAVIISTR
ncbi:MAG: hypothetical protein C0425_08935 [Chlorobiaceae bacterium]|nr:hypothetical protein [Chlorobiaceae bacterium]MBA4310447.1 hypothetical protein [Chlorobiaceae bacterium]